MSAWFDIDDGGGDYDYSGDDDDSFRRRNIISCLHASCIQHLDLSNELWTSSVTMESFQSDIENIIVALQSNQNLAKVDSSWEVLAAIGENDQGRLFYSVGNLPTLQRLSLCGGAGSPTAIHTRVLADALSETSNGLKSLELCGFTISSRSEVEQLARGLKARVESLARLTLEDIVLDVEDKTGVLDPILLALAPVPGEPRRQLSFFRISCVETASNGAIVVSPEALGAFFAEEPVGMSRRTFHLRNLGLNDSHCEVMAQELVRHDALRRRPINEIDLTVNPAIGQQGYEALRLGLLNRRFDVGVVQVDDMNWKATFDLVVKMNREYHHDRFLENGVFSSKAMWMRFLVALTNAHDSSLIMTHPLLHCHLVHPAHYTAIWYTLRENPDWISSL
jgi:hypothetical protein